MEVIRDPVSGEACVDALAVLEEANLLKQQVLDHGYVDTVDVMPRLLPQTTMTGDHALADAARISYQKGTRKVRGDAGLVDYLIRHAHTSPIEMAELKFSMRMPIFVARQFVRHRTASLNEESARYSVLSSDFYVPEPDQWRVNTGANRQATVAGDFTSDEVNLLAGTVVKHQDLAYRLYQAFLHTGGEKDGLEETEEDEVYGDIAKLAGVGRELARMVLPLNIYTRWVWKCDLKNTLHLCKLRCDGHAQREIRVFADAIARVVEKLFPATWASWKDNFIDGIQLSRTESQLFIQVLEGPTEAYEAGRSAIEANDWSIRRADEFIQKLEQLMTFASHKHRIHRFKEGCLAAEADKSAAKAK